MWCLGICKACWSRLECLWVCCGLERLSVLGNVTAILENRCHHTVVWQKYCRKKWLFERMGPAQFVLVGLCVTWLHSRSNDSMGIASWSGGECKRAQLVFAGVELSFLKLGSCSFGWFEWWCALKASTAKLKFWPIDWNGSGLKTNLYV